MKGNYQDYIGIYDNVVDEFTCKKLIDVFEQIAEGTSNIHHGKSQFGNSLKRKDYALYFDRVSYAESKFIHEKVGECMEEYISVHQGLQDFKLASWECKVQKTEHGGGFHVWHSEHGGARESSRRVAVWTLYLSTHEGSGETEFLQQGLKVPPKSGRVVIFPASFTHVHRGNPPYGENPKYMATGWFEHLDHEMIQTVLEKERNEKTS
jgi:hypothetical protein